MECINNRRNHGNTFNSPNEQHQFFYSCKANLIMLKWNLRHLNLNNYFYHYHFFFWFWFFVYIILTFLYILLVTSYRYYLNFNYNYFKEKFYFTDCPSDFHSGKSAILLYECTAIVLEIKANIFYVRNLPW